MVLEAVIQLYRCGIIFDSKYQQGQKIYNKGKPIGLIKSYPNDMCLARTA